MDEIRLGRGGFSIVYPICEDNDDEKQETEQFRFVAKVQDTIFAEQYGRKTSEYEVKLQQTAFLAGVAPKILAAFICDPQFIIIMERATSLIEAFYTGRFDPQSQIQLMSSAFSQLHLLHHSGIIHNDLKLDNIMVINGRVIFIDFGTSFFSNDKQKQYQEYNDLFRVLDREFGNSVLDSLLRELFEQSTVELKDLE